MRFLHRRVTGPLEQVAKWGHPAAAGAVGLQAGGTPQVLATSGDHAIPFRWASVSKVLTSMALWIANEEGTVSWTDPAGPPGATLADLVSHASGLAPDDDRVLAAPRTRRIYSNRGIDLAADHLSARSGMAFREYVHTGILEPLGMTGVRFDGSPAHGALGTLEDLLKLGAELMAPTLFSASTLEMCTSVAVPGLAGVLPGFGRQDPNDWGLGVELRDGKSPHWTGTNNSPATFGHFGQSGAFVWVDPVHAIALASLSSRNFGPWARDAWPLLSDAVISAYSSAQED